jgi:hypothetical protein
MTMQLLACTSSAPKGSSSNITSGSSVSARAMATRCFMPPDKVEGQACSNPDRPVIPTLHRHYGEGLASAIDGAERYFDVFLASLSILTSLSISRHVRNST